MATASSTIVAIGSMLSLIATFPRSVVMATRHIVDIQDYPAPHSPYSHAVAANGFVFVSGQIPVRPGGGPTEIVGTTMREQTRQCMRNLKIILEAAGSSLDQVVKVTVLLARTDLYKQMNEAYAEFFPGPKPARAMARFGADIPGVLVAIEAIATVSETPQA
jgi:2-iminobutanoate/2-iminopropanoate deaminase